MGGNKEEVKDSTHLKGFPLHDQGAQPLGSSNTQPKENHIHTGSQTKEVAVAVNIEVGIVENHTVKVWEPCTTEEEGFPSIKAMRNLKF